MTVIIDGTAGITFPNSTTQLVAGAPLTTPSFTTTIGVGAATASASGAGVTFPATQSASSDANTLDDYEEGTWTPTAASQTGSITSYTSGGIYVKVGKLVFIQGYITTTTAGTAAGVLTLGGFPFSFNGISSNQGLIAFYGRESQMTGTNFGGYTNGSTGATLSQPNNGAMSWGNGYVYPFTITGATI